MVHKGTIRPGLRDVEKMEDRKGRGGGGGGVGDVSGFGEGAAKVRSAGF